MSLASCASAENSRAGLRHVRPEADWHVDVQPLARPTITQKKKREDDGVGPWLVSGLLCEGHSCRNSDFDLASIQPSRSVSSAFGTKQGIGGFSCKSNAFFGVKAGPGALSCKFVST